MPTTCPWSAAASTTARGPTEVRSRRPGKPVSYGFGWFLDPYNGRPRMWHTGTTSGFRTVIQRFTDEDLSIIILANRTDLDVARLSLQVADLLDAREVVPRK